ncbi:MAG: hypothetical protein LiPW30_223 [Parcubacteria group bacterium LiPW_30]|nr:MAG: hypothetical protein LiPW30_223 [Parcubacteria group bacterium LiPW_30]
MSGCRESVTSYQFALLISTRDPASLSQSDMLRLSIPDANEAVHSLNPHYASLHSGCRESNSGYLLPKQTYYLYTTPRKNKPLQSDNLSILSQKTKNYAKIFSKYLTFAILLAVNKLTIIASHCQT